MGFSCCCQHSDAEKEKPPTVSDRGFFDDLSSQRQLHHAAHTAHATHTASAAA
jgi:hypothetical protein